MVASGDSYYWGQGDDSLGEDSFLTPHEEETWARVEQIATDNQDYLRHHVELLVWEAREKPDLLRIVVSLLWHMEDVDPRWMAEACFMSIGDVRDLAESQPIMAFHCLDCGEHLEARSRRHLIGMYYSLKALHRGGADDKRLADLLCKKCSKQRVDHAEDQRRLDYLREQALLAEYRRRPYAERRQTREWTVLKRQIHRRDGYRCRLCGDGDTPLHVHHCTYENYAEERLEDLITLCGKCHRSFHFREAS